MNNTHNWPFGEVKTKLNYGLGDPNGVGLYFTQTRSEPSSIRANFKTSARDVTIYNVRGREQDFSLDRNGFQYLAHETVENFIEQQSIRANYYAEVEELLMRHTGAKRVVVLAHRIRQSRPDYSPEKLPDLLERPPGHNVHCDRTPASVMEAAKKYVGDEHAQLLQGRVRFINVWRPIGEAVRREPLALADWQTSSDPSNLITIRVEATGLSFDAYIGQFDQRHRWYYLREQTPSEIILIKCYDSRADGCARFCLHSAFYDPETPPNAPHRRSIEVNTLVFG